MAEAAQRLKRRMGGGAHVKSYMAPSSGEDSHGAHLKKEKARERSKSPHYGGSLRTQKY